MSIEQVVAEMPKVDTIYPSTTAHQYLFEAQCQLLAEQGWRKVPDEKELAEFISSSEILEYHSTTPKAWELYRWLMEGDK